MTFFAISVHGRQVEPISAFLQIILLNINIFWSQFALRICMFFLKKKSVHKTLIMLFTIKLTEQTWISQCSYLNIKVMVNFNCSENF